jgi:hypothetical protein
LAPRPSVSSSSSAATSWILSPSHGVTTLPLSNSNSRPPRMLLSTAGAAPSISMEFAADAPPPWLLTRLYVGDAGAVVAAPASWKLIHRPESTVEETSDSSHSGMVSGCSRRRARVGLAGAETAKKGWRNGSATTASPQSGLRTLAGGRAVGDESGGVTGALLETRSGGRPRRNGSMCRHAAGVALLLLPWRVGLGKLDDAGLAWYDGTGLAKADDGALSSCDDEQWRVGLGKLDDAGLAWYDGTGLAKADDGALSSCDDEQGLSTPADAPGGGLHPCHRNALRVRRSSGHGQICACGQRSRNALS